MGLYKILAKSSNPLEDDTGPRLDFMRVGCCDGSVVGGFVLVVAPATAGGVLRAVRR